MLKKGQSVFITGTGTSVGKTLITGFLARFLRKKGLDAVTQKWVQTGSDLDRDIETHDRLMQVSFSTNFIQERCPYLLPLPASPHLAARHSGMPIQKDKIIHSFYQLSGHFESVLVEGSGGVLVPYSETEYVIDIAKELDLPVLIVASLSLGSINQTLLTIEALAYRKLTILGVIFTCSTAEILPEIFIDTPAIVSALTGVKIWSVLPYETNLETLYGLFENDLDHK